MSRNDADGLLVGIGCLFWLIYAAAVVGLVYTAVHFILKLW